MAILPDEIWLLIGARVSQSELAKLCRTSRRLNSILMPRLYSEPRIQSASWEVCLAFFISLSAKAGITKRLYIGRDIEVRHPMPKNIFEKILDTVEGSLRVHQELTSL